MSDTKLCPFRCPRVFAWEENRNYADVYFGPCLEDKCAMFRFKKEATRTLGNGMEVIVDEEDAGILSEQPWWWHGRYVKGNGTYLHRAIIERQYGPMPRGMVIDHIDGDPLNNRRSNLRICLQAENVRNNKPRSGKRSRFKGVFQQASGRWTAQITYNGEKHCLGTYDTEEQAAKEYDNAAISLIDAYRRLNFDPVSDGRPGYCGLAGKP